jgi:hypothetical protein
MKKAKVRVVSANAVRQNVKTINGGRLVANPIEFPSGDRNPIANIGASQFSWNVGKHYDLSGGGGLTGML